VKNTQFALEICFDPQVEVEDFFEFAQQCLILPSLRELSIYLDFFYSKSALNILSMMEKTEGLKKLISFWRPHHFSPSKHRVSWVQVPCLSLPKLWESRKISFSPKLIPRIDIMQHPIVFFKRLSWKCNWLNSRVLHWKSSQLWQIILFDFQC